MLERSLGNEKTIGHRRKGTQGLNTQGGGDNWMQLKHIREEKQSHT